MPDIEQRFIDQAAVRIRQQEEAERTHRLHALAAQLQEEYRRQAQQNDFPTDREEGLARIAEFEKREAALQAKRPLDRSAAEDAELDNLVRRLGEMRKRARTLGWLPKEVAAA